ncbi:DUF4834 family protein [Roseivirga sp.]|uniref:DUF4834 family protein n=1 Tax=Roseivirga sp. TaxID=1964215 RepID=UPI003B8B2900
MGYILKYILPIIVFYWIFRSIGRFMSRMMNGGQPQQNFSGRREQKKPTDGNVNVEYAPSKKNPKSSDNFKGGDYVDYEEVD